jgi:hypothetical protein
MSDPKPILQLRQRLAELGCPLAPARRIVAEAADHFEDLRQAGLAGGLTETAAHAQAEEHLGKPMELADRQVLMLRESSWWGRHPRLGFGLVPILATPVLWMLFWAVAILAIALIGSTGIQLYFEVPAQYGVILFGVSLGNYAVMGMIAAFYHQFARRAALPFKWSLLACGLCSFYALFFHAMVEPHSFTLGIYGQVNHWFLPAATSNWPEATVPMLVLLIAYARQQRATQWLSVPAR